MLSNNILPQQQHFQPATYQQFLPVISSNHHSLALPQQFQTSTSQQLQTSTSQQIQTPTQQPYKAMPIPNHGNFTRNIRTTPILNQVKNYQIAYFHKIKIML